MLSKLALGIIISILFIALIGLFCFVLIKLYVHKIKTYTGLIYQKDIDFQKVLNTTIVETQEQVLNNTSQDLHDDAGQQLTYINFQIENLKLDWPDLAGQLEPVSQSVYKLSGSIRGMSHSLNNQLLIQQDLLKAIASEVERLQKNPTVLIAMNIKNKSQRSFSSNEKIVIYRIFQEIVNNVFKHSKATLMEITLVSGPIFKLSISDNGKGFDQSAELPGKSSIGLNNMRQRAEFIKYQLDIASTIGSGTTVTLSENDL